MSSMDNKQKLMKSDHIKQWVDVLKSDKDRRHHEDTLNKCLFAPFLFGKCYLSDKNKWIRWGVEVKLFRDTGHPQNIVDKLEGPYFDILDTVSDAWNLICKKLKETKAVDLHSVLVLAEKTNKCKTWKDALQTAENMDFFSKLRKLIEATSNEKSEKIGMAVMFSLKQYADYVVESVVKLRDISKELESLGSEDVQRNFYRTKGNECFKVGRFSDALKHYSDAIKTDRFNYILYSNRAQTNLNLRKFQDALCDARRAVILKPDWPKGHYRYAQAFYELGKTDRAKAVNRNGLEICRKALRATGSGQTGPSISYLEVQAEKFSQKESEEDEVPELVEASSSNSDSGDSEIEDVVGVIPESPLCNRPNKPTVILHPNSPQIDAKVLQSIISQSQNMEEQREQNRQKKEQKARYKAEEEKRKKEEEERRKKNKEAKERQKEADRVEKADRKRRDEEKRLAEKARMEKIAAKREVELMLKQGSEAYLDKRGRQSVTFYQKAHELIGLSSEKWGDLREEDYVTFLYAWGMASLESAIVKEVHDAVQRFQLMLNNHAHVRSPLAYYGLAYAYFKHCKFHEAFEPLDKGDAMIKKFKYVVETWPGTSHIIKETITGQMEIAIENLRDRCKNPPPPDAICRLQECPTQREIYLTDPEFKGYVSTSCSEHCIVEYHIVCWKRVKSDWDGIVHDKDVLNKACNTPDCLGDVMSLIIYGADGFPKTEVKSELLQAKKEKEKVKTKGKTKSKQEKKRQKKLEAKRSGLEKGQGDNGERLESVSSSQGDKDEVMEQLLMPRREKHDDDTISTTSSNDIKRHSRDMDGGAVSIDGDDDSPAAPPGMYDIDDLLDDGLPISIPAATYVLKRDDFQTEATAAKKSKPSKVKTKKKKTKAAADLNIQLQFVDEGQRSLMTSDDVMSPQNGNVSSAPGMQENPFIIPDHLKAQKSDFERSLPPTFSQTVKTGPPRQTYGGNNVKPFNQVVTPESESDEEKSQKIALLFHLSDLFDKLGPVLYNDPRLEMELDKLPDAQPVIARYGGLCSFLLQSEDFYVLDDHVSLARDSNKCQEIFHARNNRLKELGLPPPQLTGIGFISQPPQVIPALPTDGGSAYPTGVPKGPAMDGLDSFDIPGIGAMNDIDDINFTPVSRAAGVVVSEQNKLGAEKVVMSGWPQDQDLDKELDRVLASQQHQDGGAVTAAAGASLQSLSRAGQTFSTREGVSSFGSGLGGAKSVSVDISSLPAYDSGLGSMGPSSDKNILQNGTGTNQGADLKSAATSVNVTTTKENNNTIAADDPNAGLTAAGVQIGGSAGGSVGQLQCESEGSSVDGPEHVIKTGTNVDAKVVAKDMSDGIDTGSDNTSIAVSADADRAIPISTETDCAIPVVVDTEKKIDDNAVEGVVGGTKTPVIEVDISDKTSGGDRKMSTQSADDEIAVVDSEKGLILAEYQKLQARYKLVHNACKYFQEKRKNMKPIMTQTIVVKWRTSGMNTEPYMEFEELKVTKDRLQTHLHETMQKYRQLQMDSNNQLEVMKTTIGKKEAKEKELTNNLSEARRQQETDTKAWGLERARAMEESKTKDIKIRELEAEKILFQNRWTTKEHEFEEFKRKSQIERDHWVAEKLKLQDAFQVAERNYKAMQLRATEGEVEVLQLRCTAECLGLETWLREGEFHLKTFKMILQRTPDTANGKLKEGLKQWENCFAENKRKLEVLKGKFEEQIRLVKGGRILSQLPSIELPQITKPSMPPPPPPPGNFMHGPRPGFFPPTPPPGIRPGMPPPDMNGPRPTHIPNAGPPQSPSPVPTTKPPTTKPTQPGPISVPVSIVTQGQEVNGDSKAGHMGPAKASPAQVTVPLQEQAPWPPAVSSTPPHLSPPGMPSGGSHSLPPVSSASQAGSLGAVGTRPQSVAGANAAPGSNRPQTTTTKPPAAASSTTTAAPSQPRTNFERILFPLQTLFPQHNQVQLTKAIKEVRQANNGSLSGLSVDEIIRRSASILKHQPPLRTGGARPAVSSSSSTSSKTWQTSSTSNGGLPVPQGQRLVQGVMQGIAAQQGKFQWPNDSSSAASFPGKGFLDDEEDPCVICHEEMTPNSIKVLDCGHRFHEECIKQWLNEQSTCPNCRHYTLLPDEYPSLH